jgi:hypothetical protein
MASKGNRPGFFDTFRYGWTPPKQRRAARAAGHAAAPGSVAAAKAAGRSKAGAQKKNGAAPTAGSKASPELVRRKDELSHQFAELQWDLGGIAYEMARRDHYRLEVLNAQAAKLQEVDAELGQIERMLKLDEAGAAGTCPACGSLQARGALFCWHCGKELKPPTSSQPTQASPKPKKAAKPSASRRAAPKAKLKPRRRSR